MAEFLTFVLVAPLGAMGALAVGERRGGWDRPGRSAVLGLLAGCLGLDRTAEADHAALSAGFGLAIRREGGVTSLLSDYHTAQTAPTRRNRSFATRREQLAIPKHEQETVLTRRDYRADIAFTAALWRRAAAPVPWSLEDVAAAMTAPRFAPYLGRKSCPLGLPMAPHIVTAVTVREALEARDAGAREIERKALARPGGGTLWADNRAEGEPELGLPEARPEIRRDEPISRARWQFGLREEIVADWPAQGSAG